MQRVLLWAILGVGIIASLLTANERARVENRNRNVELVADYSEVAQIAAGSGKSTCEVLKELKSAGVTSIAVSEPTIGDLMAQGRVTLRYPQFARQNPVLIMDTDFAKELSEQLRRLFGNTKVVGSRTAKEATSPGYATVTILQPLAAEYIQLLPAGIPSRPIKEAASVGLSVVARLTNYPGATPASIRRILRNVRSLGISKLVFQGDQVLGFKGAVKTTAKSIRQLGLVFGRVEFARQKGELELARDAEGNVIPVHSITQNEMPILSKPDIVERYKKAVRERGIRLCYVRMYETASGDLVGENCDYVQAIADAIRRDGYVLGQSSTITEIRVDTWQLVLTTAGVAAGVLLLTTSVINIPLYLCLGLLVASIALSSLLVWSGELGRKVVALIAALTFPTLGAFLASTGSASIPNRNGGIFAATARRLLAAVLVSIAGGLLVAGLLSSRTFMLRVDQFAGIKVAHVVPILLIAASFAGGIAWQRDTWAVQKKRLVESYRKLLCSPVLMWQATGIIFLLVIVALMVARSGNEAGIGVSTLELRFRTLLDRVLIVRPRTKEFLIGYPALIAGIICALRGRRRTAAVLITIGSIALVSVVNTFCHIHTPLAVSAFRILNGLLVGAIVGTVLWLAVGRILISWEQPLHETREPSEV